MFPGEEVYWLALSKAPGIGLKRFYKLIKTFGDPRQVWQAGLSELSPVIGRKVAVDFIQFRRKFSMEKEWEQLEKGGYKIVLVNDRSYPGLLKKIHDPPPVLYYKGEFRPEDQFAVAVVGSRAATPSGLSIARELAAGLAVQGITVVSGLARGIDSAAHRGALSVKGGRTIAVLGSGIDRVYPPENKDLMEEISDHGVVCSEFPLGTNPFPGNFPARNRVISGLSLGVTVVEASKDSGSLITAEFALEQGREVFAVPGSIERKGSKGPHRLLKEGAKLVEEVGDILEALNLPYLSFEEMHTIDKVKDEFSPVEKELWGLLAAGETHIDILIRDSGLPVSEVNSALVQMELKGIIMQVAANTFRRVEN
jgi:DNA processing protein